MTGLTSAPVHAVELNNVFKVFGSTRALQELSFSIAPGTVNALVGENGAGKSTALGILAGRIAPTSGEVTIFGSAPRLGDPRASRRAGVVAIYQELTIVPALSAEANVFLADPLTRGGMLAERQMRSRYVALCEQLGLNPVPRGIRADRLSVAEQQMLEILRAVVSDARVILFDEPTASLAVSEREALYRLVGVLKDKGVAMVFVSHNLEEVLDLADTITVFRDGRLVAHEERGSFTKASLVKAMIGDKGDVRLAAEMLDEEVVATPARTRREPVNDAPPILRARNVTVPGSIEGIDIEVRGSEIMGVGGLVGSGRSTLLRALAGLEPMSTGHLQIDGKDVQWPRTVRRALRYGIALVPEDRKTQGLVLTMSAMENIALADFGKASQRGVVSLRTITAATTSIAAAFGFRSERLRTPAWQLSGGNQQKLLLARWKYVTPRILLADEPTRGIDIGAKAEILASLEDMADAGLGIVAVSSELEEIAAISDRVVVLSEGRMAGVLDGTTDGITSAAILNLAFSVTGTA